MPFIRVQTSQAIDEKKRASLLKSLSAAAARLLGKPESYVMVAVEPSVPMLFAGGADPSALVEVRSIGNIDARAAKAISAGLSEILAKEAGVPAERTFLNFFPFAGAMWGHGGDTYG
jgi:phenylpyruvate tautomerase